MSDRIFETLGLRTPILLVASLGSDAGAMVEGSAAQRAFTNGETASMAGFLRDQILHPIRSIAASSVHEWAKTVERLDTTVRQAQAGSR